MQIKEIRQGDNPGNALPWLRSGSAVRLRREVAGASKMADRLLAEIERTVGQLFGEMNRAKVVAHGIESLHLWLKPAEIARLSAEINAWARLNLTSTLNDFVVDTLRHRRLSYLSTFVVVRFYVPFSLAAKTEDPYFELTAHNPHLDSWFGFPAEAVNLLVAVGRIQPANGVLFFPEAEKLARPSNPDEPSRDWALGAPLVYGCEPKDVLLFSGDVAHGTVLNRSEETRVSATFRLFLSDPDRGRPAAFSYVYGGPYFRTSGARRVSAALIASRRGFQRVFVVAIRGLKQTFWILRGCWRKRFGEARETEMPEAPARPSEGTSVCRRKTEVGWVEFSRRCPHSGADLTRAPVRDGSVRCPWHGVGFSLSSGEPDCSGVTSLKIRHAAPSTAESVENSGINSEVRWCNVMTSLEAPSDLRPVV